VGGGSAWTYSTTDPARGQNQATWTPSLPGPGFYEIQAYIPRCNRTAATNAARYQVNHNGGTTVVSVDQQAAKGTWASLGIFSFSGQPGQSVILSDVAGDTKRAVRFDALIWVVRADTTPPEARVVKITPKENGVTVTWAGRDDVSGVASYDVQVRQLPSGIWRDWQVQAQATGAWFGPTEGKQFAFRARARDAVGNLQPWRDGDDLTTNQATP
jgi:hypothetical protein